MSVIEQGDFIEGVGAEQVLYAIRFGWKGWARRLLPWHRFFGSVRRTANSETPIAVLLHRIMMKLSCPPFVSQGTAFS